ncbi:uncharacterized protein RB166_016078 [Leptodactylus fuscus]
MDNLQLQESILHFSLDDGPHGNQGYSRVLLQLFGYIGHGKSSFINSCLYIINVAERFIEYAEAGEKDGGAMTMERRAYKLTQNVTIVDNRGLDDMSRFKRAEIYAQLGGFIPIDEKVEWPDNYTDIMYRLEDAALNPNYSDFIVPILVARNLLSDDENAKMKEFMYDCVKMTGVIPIIVITRKNSGDVTAIENSFRNMGAEVVISLENYTKEDHINRINIQGRPREILTIIHNALKEVKFRLGQQRNAQTDWVRRKMFLLKYIHMADQEKREEQWRQEEVKREEEERRRRNEKKNRTSDR